ncbi:MAG: DUF2007 domain-containing protein [Hyphomonadaceae bacterium]
MIEVLRTNDPVKLSFVMARLQEAGCAPFLADRFMAMAEGGISAFQQRILVPDEDEVVAKRVIRDVEAGAEAGAFAIADEAIDPDAPPDADGDAV